jgi:DNA polymerase III beta subunit, central domain
VIPARFPNSAAGKRRRSVALARTALDRRQKLEHEKTETENMTTINLNLRQIVALSKYIASTEETRYYLNGVNLTVKGGQAIAVATDGHKLAAVRMGVEDETADIGFLIPNAFLANFKFKKSTPSDIDATLTEDNISIAFCGQTYSSRPIDGTFPDWRHVLPKGGYDVVHSHFDPDIVNDFRLLARALDIPKPEIAPNDSGPAYVRFGAENDIIGVIMPMRSAVNPARPTWTEALA